MPALERLIGGDTEVEVELRKQRVASRIIEAAPWLSLGDLPEDYATFIRMYSPH